MRWLHSSSYMKDDLNYHFVLFYQQKELQDIRILNIAIPDEYVEHGNVDILRKEVGIDNDSIIQKVTEKYKTIYREN